MAKNRLLFYHKMGFLVVVWWAGAGVFPVANTITPAISSSNDPTRLYYCKAGRQAVRVQSAAIIVPYAPPQVEVFLLDGFP